MASIIDGVKIGFGMFIVLPLLVLFVLLLVGLSSYNLTFFFVVVVASIITYMYKEKHKVSNKNKRNN